MTYDELIAAVRVYTEKEDLSDNDENGNPRIDTLINQAELRLLRDIDLEEFRVTDSQTMTEGSPELSISTGILAIRNVFVTETTGFRVNLRRVDEAFLREYWPDPDEEGLPKYYTLSRPATLRVAPTPDEDYSTDIESIQRPTQLSSTNTTTWLSENADDALLYSVLVEVMKYMKEPAQEIEVFEQGYQQALQRLGRFNMARNRTSEFESGEPRVRSTPSGQ